MKNPDSRPEIANKIPNINEYDTIFIGFPIWWYVAPTIIDTFIESYDFSGKTIIPFATSGGSGFGKTVEILKALASKEAKWKDGKLMNNISETELKNWINNI